MGFYSLAQKDVVVRKWKPTNGGASRSSISRNQRTPTQPPMLPIGVRTSRPAPDVGTRSLRSTPRSGLVLYCRFGASHTRRMFVHILPNVSHVSLVQLSQHVVQFIKAEVILSFLGLGVPVDSVSWGTMLAEAQSELVIGKWWQLVAASVSMALLVTAFSMLTDSLRDALDPKIK